MATYTYGTSASANARPDLAPIIGRYNETIMADAMGGVGWGALQLCGILEVPGSGRLTYDGAQFKFIGNTANFTGIRPLNADRPPTAETADYTDYAVDLKERGLEVPWDEADPQIRVTQNRAGTLGVETKHMRRSVNHAMELVDTLVFGTAGLSAATTPFTGVADVSATGDQWSSASAGIIADIEEAMQNYEGLTGTIDLDTLVCSARVKLHLAKNTALRTAAAVTATSGPMSNEMLMGALSAFGIRYLIVVPTGRPMTDTVVLTRAGRAAGRDPDDAFVGSVLCWGRLPSYSHDDTGLSLQTYSSQAGRVHYAYASHHSDVVIPVEGGARITDVY